MGESAELQENSSDYLNLICLGLFRNSGVFHEREKNFSDAKVNRKMNKSFQFFRRGPVATATQQTAQSRRIPCRR